MAGQIKQSVNFLNGYMLRAVGDLHNLVARADLPFFKNTAIKARSLVRDQKRRNLRVVHPYTDAIAGDARLRHFKQGSAYPVTISDANFVIGKAIEDHGAWTVELLYADHEGGQRAVTRFIVLPVGHPGQEADDAPHWLASASRHWNVDRPDPR